MPPRSLARGVRFIDLAGVLAFAVIGCSARERPSGPLRVERTVEREHTLLTLIAARGILLNARVKPALELPGGEVIQFDSPGVTPDSAYFTSPPTALVPRAAGRPAGTLRASICSEAELVCRSVTLEL